MNGRNLLIVGEAAIADLAAVIGVARWDAQRVRVITLSSEQINDDGLGFLADHPTESTDVFAAIGPAGLNHLRFDLWGMLKLIGYRCATLIHPQATFDASMLAEENVLIGPNVTIEPSVRIGRGTFLGASATIGASTVIGPWCWLARGAVVGAGATIGAHSVLGMGVQLADNSEFAGPGEIDVAGTYRGKFPRGTFISPEFPANGARLVYFT